MLEKKTGNFSSILLTKLLPLSTGESMDTQTHVKRFLDKASPMAGDTVEIIDQQHFLYGSLATVTAITQQQATVQIESTQEPITVACNQIACSISLQQLSAST